MRETVTSPAGSAEPAKYRKRTGASDDDVDDVGGRRRGGHGGSVALRHLGGGLGQKLNGGLVELKLLLDHGDREILPGHGGLGAQREFGES